MDFPDTAVSQGSVDTVAFQDDLDIPDLADQGYRGIVDSPGQPVPRERVASAVILELVLQGSPGIVGQAGCQVIPDLVARLANPDLVDTQESVLPASADGQATAD